MARSTKRIGDDQLIGGLPKHMVGVSTQQSLEEFKKAKTEAGKAGGNNPTDPKGNYYWTVHPKPGACDTCKAMEGKEFMEEPERPHPNCRCEIKKHPLRRPKRYISGLLEGFAWHRFTGGAQVDIELRGISGGLTSGALIFSDHGHAKQLACMPYTTNSTSFTVDQSPPVV